MGDTVFMQHEDGMPVGAEFRQAALDYRLLLDRGYPVNATLKLVGDRYRLDRTDRIVLFRGVLPSASSSAIATKTAGSFPAGSALCVDGYNILFTVINYRRGHPLFVGTDGLLRDAGGAHGRIERHEDLEEAAGLLADMLAALAPSRVAVFLDAPVSGSGRHAAALRDALAAGGVTASVELVPSSDPAVRDFEGGYAATADSAVAIVSRSPVYDLARAILVNRYGASFFDLGDMFR